MTLRHDDLDPAVSAGERAVLTRIAGKLERERPLPRATYWGQLRRRLVADADAGHVRSRLGHRWALTFLVTGSALLAGAAAGLVV